MCAQCDELFGGHMSVVFGILCLIGWGITTGVGYLDFMAMGDVALAAFFLAYFGLVCLFGSILHFGLWVLLTNIFSQFF